MFLIKLDEFVKKASETTRTKSCGGYKVPTIKDLLEAVEQLRVHTAAILVGQIDFAGMLKVLSVVQVAVGRLHVEHLLEVDQKHGDRDDLADLHDAVDALLEWIAMLA